MSRGAPYLGSILLSPRHSSARNVGAKNTMESHDDMPNMWNSFLIT